MLATCTQVKQLMRDKSTWRGGCCIFLLIITLVFVAIMASKFARLFGGR
jgi:hypothetical protein